MIHSNSRPLRVDGVDILRGLSIFFVLMNHIHMRLFVTKIPYLADLPAQLVSSMVWNGQRGVQIFFCISGFLIASTSIKRWGSLSQMKASQFYWLRVARIVPLFAALMLILSLLHLIGIENFVVSEETGGLGRALLAAFTFSINVLEATRGYLPANWDILWSLSVEEMFYLFFPIFCVFFARFRFFYVVLILFIGLGPFGRTVFSLENEVWSEYSYLGSMDAIALGILTAILAAQIQFSRTTLKWFFLSGTAILVFTLGFTRTANHLGLKALGVDMTILAAGTCLVILAASQTRWQAPCLFYPLLKLGERSYEIYLTHMFVIFGFFGLFLHQGSPVGLIPLLFITSIFISAVLGEIVGRFYSEPLNSLLRKGLKTKVHQQVLQ